MEEFAARAYLEAADNVDLLARRHVSLDPLKHLTREQHLERLMRYIEGVQAVMTAEDADIIRSARVQF